MIYRYWYIDKGEPLVFGQAMKEDFIDLGPIYWKTAKALEKIEYQARFLGRRVLRIERAKAMPYNPDANH